MPASPGPDAATDPIRTPGLHTRPGRGPLRSIALVGPDGAGKSTIAHLVVDALPVPARYVYMGVNLDSSRLMLPTTRLALAIKRARGRRPQMTAEWSPKSARSRSRRRAMSQAYAAVRLLAWMAEEWYRAVVAAAYNRRGYLVVFDRHFFYDYHASHVMRRPGRSAATRLHGELLRRFYPRPDFVICLDAPAALLHARKGEHDVESLERRRREYLALEAITPDFAVVDTTRPLAKVVDEIRTMVEARLR